MTDNLSLNKAATARGRSEEHYRALFEDGWDALIIVDAQGKGRYASPAVATLLGFSDEEFVGLDCMGLIHSDDLLVAYRLLTQVMAEPGGSASGEFRSRRKDGSWVWLAGTAVNLLDDPGVRGIACNFRDITQRLQVEEALRQSEERYRLLVAHSPDLIVYQDRELRYTWASNLPPAHEKDVLGKTPSDLLDQEQADQLTAIQRGVLLSGKVARVEMPMTLGGVHRFFDMMIEPRRGLAGETTGLASYLRDITERKEAAELNARLAAIVDSSDDAIIGTTLDGTITSWNRGAERLFGYSAKEAVGRPAAFLVPPGRPDEEERALARLRRGESLDRVESQQLTKDGRMIDVSLTISPVRDSRGRIIGASQIARDITERKKGEQALQELNATLEHRVAERTAVAEEQAARLRELASQVSLAEQRERRKLAALLHDELAQSLALGKLKLTMLEVELPDGQDDGTINSIRETLSTAIQFTRSLMNDLSPPMLYDMGFSAAVQELAGRMHEQHGLNVAVETSGKVELPEDLRAFLFQAVREMLTNVVKYGSTDRASVTITKTADLVRVVVEDRGVGCDPATLPTRPSDNRGFGLFHIRERAQLLGGNLEFNSRPGEGTRCCLEVPVEVHANAPIVDAPRPLLPPTPSRAQVAASAKAGADGRIRVVIVDDHAPVRHLLGSMLRGMPDMELVGEGEDGQQALDLACRLQPHVVLLDISLPGMDGVETTRRLRVEAPNVQVIGMSMGGDSAGTRVCQAGAVAFLNKESGRQVLGETIRAHATPQRGCSTLAGGASQRSET